MKPIKDIMQIDRVAEDVARWGEKELKYYSKYDFFELSDGLRILLVPARAHKIENVIWESDEDLDGHYRTADDIAPNEQVLYDLFITENMRQLREVNSHAEATNRDLYVSKPTRTSDTLRTIYVRHDFEANDWHDVERKLTQSEVNDLKKWEEEQRVLMKQRLDRYWKRYKNKVRVDTYWANR